MIEGNVVELGIGGLLAVTVLKTVLPYVKPAKNGHVAKNVCEVLKPVMEKQTDTLNKQTILLEHMNEREIIMNTKIVSDHETIKHTDKVAVSINGRIDDIYREMPKRNTD